jgi:hypothetical protein
MNSSKTQPARIVTHWRRFSMGLWRVPRGDIADAYSASSLPKVSVFTHEGRLYTNCGCDFSKWLHAEVNGYPLIVADDYRGAESEPYSYEGREVAYRGKVFRLGAKIIFVASDPTVEEWRQSARVLYGEGGNFRGGLHLHGISRQPIRPEVRKRTRRAVQRTGRVRRASNAAHPR